jgi:hypothetical protein
MMSDGRLFDDDSNAFPSEPGLGRAQPARPNAPTPYRALRAVVEDAEHGLLQLAARAYDGKRFVLVARPGASIPPGGDLVDALNARITHAHELRAEQRAAKAALKRIQNDKFAGDKEVRAAFELDAQATARARKVLGMPQVTPVRCAPVACAMRLYQAQDEAAAEASAAA